MTTRLTLVRSAAAAGVALAATFALSGCSAQFPNIAGVWKTSDGTPTKTISDDGNCTNLLYSKGADGQMYGTDDPGMCHIIRTSPGGKYVFQVHQASYWRNYVASFSKKDTVISLSYHGKHFTTLTREPGSH
ncbi:hypothetical protein AX769_11175 [Frondihabitans sp. PAMC 28766]|uniref:hypothetical protein n=1 Tax=Frondihabitans sp. PAMC 28766 TaxID=1795630 RepID=UPI00078C1733|nr:hypothetical protein [Frondihabitans sp. PAMC 28766]AMM20599.1 hypothetical protein AX769_11175 [Frondihabitans sp. PAMC 28766]